jgi:hypothetical protein
LLYAFEQLLLFLVVGVVELVAGEELIEAVGFGELRVVGLELSLLATIYHVLYYSFEYQRTEKAEKIRDG